MPGPPQLHTDPNNCPPARAKPCTLGSVEPVLLPPLSPLILAPSLRIASFLLLLTPFAGHAQSSGIGLEIPAPAAPSKGRFLAGAYATGGYVPLAAPTAYGYGVQPYLRYQLGTSATGRPRPFVQYTFAPYRLQS